MTMLLPLVLLKSLYVGDFVCGAKNMNSAFSLSREIKLCLKSGGFNIRKWNSNSASLLQSLKQESAFSGDFATNSKECVQEEDESFSKSVFKQGTGTEQKVLGMLWNPNQDELSYDLTKILEGVEVQPVTRILILSTATRFFDPLGLTGSLSNDVFERRTSTGSCPFSFLGDSFAQIFSQIVSIRVKKLSNTNCIASRHITREKSSLPVDVHCSKTSLLKLPNISSYFTLQDYVSKTVQGSKGLGRVSGYRTQPRVVVNFVRPKTSWKCVF